MVKYNFDFFVHLNGFWGKLKIRIQNLNYICDALQAYLDHHWSLDDDDDDDDDDNDVSNVC